MQDSVSNRTSTSSLLLNDHLLRKENNDEHMLGEDNNYDHLMREDINRRSLDQSLLMSRGESMAVVENHQEMENTVVIKGQQEEVEEVVGEGVVVMEAEEGMVVMMETSCRFCGSQTGEDHVHFQLLHPVQVCSLHSFFSCNAFICQTFQILDIELVPSLQEP